VFNLFQNRCSDWIRMTVQVGPEYADAITVASLQQLAKKIGIQNPESMKFKDDLIRAIQTISGTRPCFQLDPHHLCDVITGCHWRKECQKLIAVWKR